MISQQLAALLTVEEAKTKWCPEGRSGNDSHQSTCAINRSLTGYLDEGSECLGDRCMFWRWHDTEDRPQKHVAVAPATWIDGHIDGSGEYYPGDYTDPPQDGREWIVDTEEGYWYVPAPSLPPRGFCGRAGHPLQAALLEAQMEVLGYQIHDHRRA